MPKVSIIIPLYNKEQYIGKTLDTVLAQTFSDYEVIIVNDGSIDSSLCIANEYAKRDGRIKTHTIPNGGVSNARNVGLKYAVGDWIQFLDADDTINPDYLEKAVAAAEENNVDIVFSNFFKINPEGRILEKVESCIDGVLNHSEFVDKFIELQYKNGFFGFISNKLLKHEFVIKSGVRFPTDIVLAEDLTFYIELYKCVEKVCFLNTVSFNYRQFPKKENIVDNIDYRVQLEIQIKIRNWLECENKYNSYQIIIDKRISDYIYSIIFQDNERGQGISKAYYDIVDNPEIFRSLCGQEFTGFQKKVLCLIEKRKYRLLVLLFKIRNLIRRVYRGMRRNG